MLEDIILIGGYVIGACLVTIFLLIYLKNKYQAELKELTNDEWREKYRYNKEKTSFDSWTYFNEYDGPMVMSIFLWPIAVFLIIVYVFLYIIYEGVKKIFKVTL